MDSPMPSTSDEADHDLDLPLMSNIKDIRVWHYALDLSCDFTQKQFYGSITLFCTQPTVDEKRSNIDETHGSEESDLICTSVEVDSGSILKATSCITSTAGPTLPSAALIVSRCPDSGGIHQATSCSTSAADHTLQSASLSVSCSPDSGSVQKATCTSCTTSAVGHTLPSASLGVSCSPYSGSIQKATSCSTSTAGPTLPSTSLNVSCSPDSGNVQKTTSCSTSDAGHTLLSASFRISCSADSSNIQKTTSCSTSDAGHTLPSASFSVSCGPDSGGIQKAMSCSTSDAGHTLPSASFSVSCGPDSGGIQKATSCSTLDAGHTLPSASFSVSCSPDYSSSGCQDVGSILKATSCTASAAGPTLPSASLSLSCSTVSCRLPKATLPTTSVAGSALPSASHQSVISPAESDNTSTQVLRSTSIANNNREACGSLVCGGVPEDHSDYCRNPRKNLESTDCLKKDKTNLHSTDSDPVQSVRTAESDSVTNISYIPHIIKNPLSHESSNISIPETQLPLIDSTCVMEENPFSSNDASGSSSNNTACCVQNKEIRANLSEDYKQFTMVLDCWDIIVQSVEEIPILEEDFVILENHRQQSRNVKERRNKDLHRVHDLLQFQKYLKSPGIKLEHKTGKKCVRIYKSGIEDIKQFPRAIRIWYSTSPKGQSLKWTKDQDGRECVFTHGHWINNRSLFPSQDVPVAMATWQATVHVPSGHVVLMSGDEDPVIQHRADGLVSYYYYTNMPMPSSTLALAVGRWRCAHTSWPKNVSHTKTSDDVSPTEQKDNFTLPWRLFCPAVHLELATQLFTSYMPTCLNFASDLLGPHPFHRLDVLIVPASFCSLGMASPSLMFVSQSLLSSDRFMCIRLAHEVSHSWFGLLIGPRDWTEEWLSEGFCTYTEGIIHSKVMRWTAKETRDHMELRDHVRYKTLLAEVQTTDTQFQTLRPNKGDGQYSSEEINYVKNGMNPEKGFMQVHYLKGYFLLKYLEQSVGVGPFQRFLRSFVKQFREQLITSQDFLDLLFRELPELGISEKEIKQDWLDSPGLPEAIHGSLSRGNALAKQVNAQMVKFKDFSLKYRNLHWTKRRKLSPDHFLSKFSPDQLVLFLEELLSEDFIHKDILDSVREFYKIPNSNADVQHRWCELVIRQKHKKCYSDISSFLLHNQAMGVYLFGELVISGDAAQRSVAELSFHTISADMEEGVCSVVKQMLFGT